MKIQKSILLILFIFSFQFSFSQKESWHWYFGVNAGLDFSSGVPVVVTNGALNTYEGVASISDSLGNLLFYTDGQFVYDATHNQMPNGFGLLGNGSSTQSAIIIKKPGSTNLFYVFTTDYNHNGVGTGDGLNYSIVDMSLNGSLGDVTVKNVFVRSNVWEKLSAVKHGNNTDYWILTNDWIADDIYAYLLDSSGFNMTPVVSNAGPFHNQDAGMSAGYIKANRQGNKLALAMWQKASFDLCDFNNQTGIASNHIVIQALDMYWTYGVEFSPDGTKLYGSKLEVPSQLFQFDLTAGSPAAILASRVTLGTSSILYYYSALQIASDGKIYCAHRYDNYVGVINQPDSSGVLCNSIDNGIYLNGKQSTLGLPNFVPDYVLPSGNAPIIALASSDTTFCEKQCIDFYDISTNNPTSWQWFFPGAQPDTSTLQNPTSICYNGYGSFDVTLIACNGTGCDTLVIPNFITEYQAPLALISQSNDTLFSNGSYFSYQWYEVNNGVIAGATSNFYVTNVLGNYYVIVMDSNGCEGSSNLISITTGISPPAPKGGVTIMPNPFTTEILISFKNQSARQISVCVKDVLGQVVFSNFLTSNSQTIKLDLRNLQNGIYFLEVNVDDKRVVKKIVKSN